jgi:hypothetical protein
MYFCYQICTEVAFDGQMCGRRCCSFCIKYVQNLAAKYVSQKSLRKFF